MLFSWMFFFFAQNASSLQIPQALESADREKVMKILGVPTSSKLLSNPYPLGGYWGLEVGVALEVVDTVDISRLGLGSEPSAELRYPRFTVGKGLYNDIDAFVHFIPYSEDNEVSGYGALIRWCFYEGKYLPVSFSAMVHASSTNVSDSFVSQTFGYELTLGFIMENFTLYFGGGPLVTQGKFMSGSGVDSIVEEADPDVNSENTLNTGLTESHTFVGMSVHYLEYFLALQIDRYTYPAYSAKVGVRF